MKVEKLTATLGAQVLGVDLRDVEAAREVLPPLLVEHGVLVFRDQPLDDAALWEIAAAFGDTAPHPNTATFQHATKEVKGIDHDEKTPPEDTGFHSDYTFHPVVAEIGVLQARIVPTRGGDTIWTDMQAAFAALTPAMQDFLCTLSLRHGFTDHQLRTMRNLFGDSYIDEQPEYFEGTVHPMVVEHPVTEKPALYASPGYTRSIVELSRRESDALLNFLFAHIGHPRFHLRLHWGPRDVGIWDEIRTAHQGPFDYWPERRRMARATAGQSHPRPARPKIALPTESMAKVAMTR